jgi:glycosyltransferase involved in cell wall biosynthesis
MDGVLIRASGGQPPEISVVIPTYNRAGSVLRVLKSLANQTADPTSFEVVLVLDGCTDNSAEVARRAELPYTLHVVEQPGKGRAAARNHGVRKSSAPLILFLDDDMECDPGLIATHLAAHRKNPGEVVLGYYPMAPEPNSTPERERIRLWWDEHFAKRSAPGHKFTYHDFATGNVSLSREMLVNVNGFEETMPRIATCEDWELGFRLLKAGAKFRDCREAWCIHRTAASTRHILYRAREEGGGQAVMAIKHPEIFFDLPLSQICGIFQQPVLWPAVRLLWRYPALIHGASELLNWSYLLMARLNLRRAQAFVEPYARRCEYWRGLRLVFQSADEWSRTCRKAIEVRDSFRMETHLNATETAASR